jgi:hypothetical protein
LFGESVAFHMLEFEAKTIAAGFWVFHKPFLMSPSFCSLALFF